MFSSDDLKISVITVSYNSAKTIGATIDSVNQQTHANIEHVFIDGGSTDNTVDIIKSTSKVTSRIVSEPDQGIYDALNKGLALATGHIVGFLHSDDYFAHEDVLKKIAIAFAIESVDAVYSDLQYVSQSSEAKVVRNWRTQHFTEARLKRGWMPPHPTLYVKKQWYDAIGGFDLRYKIAADYYSVLQLFSIPHFKSTYIPETLVKMRVGGVSNGSLKNIVLKSREDYSALTRSGVGGGGSLLLKNLRKLTQLL
jgi:glycosyltransferase involved in cell wall biosynthesis